ncbi:MAG: hypothetical protein GYB68_08080, partial [Chloroflexi bacterium]|nr:hypothetical protein [Chloroflexota bacterium]
PELYFTDQTPNLVDAIDLQIDTNGNLFVLHSSGRVSKYFLGREDVFAFEGLPQPLIRPTSFYFNLSPFDRVFFIADPDGERLYTTSPTGTFIRNYKDSNNVVFATLSGVTNTDQPAQVYLTAGNRLYTFSRP